MEAVVRLGSRSYVKKTILEYCFKNYSNDIWLLDTRQIFDPYYLSRYKLETARIVLLKLKICRPFTLYQLKDKLFSFYRISLDANSTIIISGLDNLADDLNKKERDAMFKLMIRTLKNIQNYNKCKLILGIKHKETLNHLIPNFEVKLWEEQLYQ